MAIAEHDEAAKQRESICRIIEIALVHDQVVITELASFEYPARQLQLIEVGHFLGIGETKGNLCICPALMQFIAEQMKNEAAVSKERRKAREERALRAPCAAWRRRCSEGAAAHNLPHGRAEGAPSDGQATNGSLAQRVAIEELQEQRRSFELPAGYSEQRQFCEASLVEVLETTPGYQNSSRVKPCDKALVAWPALTGPPVQVSSFAQQADAVQLEGWRQSMLRSDAEVRELQETPGVQRPCVDPQLRNPRKYAEYLDMMLRHHLIEWSV
ncbi:unnamed protein product, partial [Prorocentrum cordatum]